MNGETSVEKERDNDRPKNSMFFDRCDTASLLELCKLIFENIPTAAVTDHNGHILFLGKAYAELLGVGAEDQIGKHITEVSPDSRMHIVAKTGRAEINRLDRIRGRECVVQRIPIKKNGKVIAVYGQAVFQDAEEVNKLAEKVRELESKVDHYKQELISLRSTRYTFDSIVDVSDSMKGLKRSAQRAAGNDLPVLITGESGTGKEMFAQAIHNASSRKVYPFIRINCSAIPRELLESELFGYEKGAFTGANGCGKPGKFELAHRGTIFLDEIADLPLEIQPKLLRVVEEKEFERVGGNGYISSDFRLIAATNQNLEAAVEQGRFRKDLFYRLDVIHLHIAPLRERKDAIIPLAYTTLKQICGESSIQEPKIEKRAERALAEYDWPGNVRELRNALGRIVSFLEGDTIHLSDLPFRIHDRSKRKQTAGSLSLKNVTSCAERNAMADALLKTGNNRMKAAELLGIHRTNLYRKMRKYGLM